METLKRMAVDDDDLLEEGINKKAKSSTPPDVLASQQEKGQEKGDQKHQKEKKDAERKLLKDLKDAERLAEKQRKEQEKKAEKERKEAERKAEKERKEAEKQAEKQRKEAEKQAEKQRKESEKQAEKERKEAEKQAVKEKKEKELLKAQPKINLFFKTSSTSVTASSLPQDTISNDGPISNSQDSSIANLTEVSDYQKNILPFHVKQNGQLFSGICNYKHESSEADSDPLIWLQKQKQNSAGPPNVAKITSWQFRTQLALAQESTQVAELLTNLRIRRLQFSHLSLKYMEDPAVPVNEEFRPPYVGSVQDIDSSVKRLLALDPFRTDLVEHISYEYDSEVEWDHEDGDDLRDDDEDDSDEDIGDQEDLKGFLSSDEDDANSSKRPKLIGPLTPIVVWGDTAKLNELQALTMDLLSGPFDPFYSPDNIESKPNDSKETQDPISYASSIMSLENKVGFESLKSSIASHNGSTGTKTLIVELLKQKFPVATAQEIKNLFDKSLERIGKKRAEKRWVVNDEASEYFAISKFPVEPPTPPPPLPVANHIKNNKLSSS